MFRSTADIRDFIQTTIEDIQQGRVTNAVARTRLNAARTYLDTIKVDMAAAHMGVELKPLVFDQRPMLVEVKNGTR